MIDVILYNISIKGIYDLIKHKLINKINSKDFSMVFNETLKEIANKYEVVISDLEGFFKSEEVIEQLELHLEDMNLDFKYLGELLLDEYIILDKKFSSELLLRDFFDSLGANLLKYPELKEHLIVKYIKALRQDHAKIIGNTNLIIENQESLNEILAQVTVFGKL